MFTITNMDFKVSLCLKKKKCQKVFQNFYLGSGDLIPLAIVFETDMIPRFEES